VRKLLNISLVILLLSGPFAFGQQEDAYFSQYWVNGLAINPAYAGSREVFNISALYQKKWAGIEGSPTNYTFSAHTPLKNEKIGLGLFFISQNYGVQKNTQVNFNYAYRFQVGRGKLALGLKGGVTFVNEDLASILSSLDDPTDPAFTNPDQNYIQPNIGFGAYYYDSRLFVGFSMPNMMNFRLDTITFKYKPSFLPKHYSYALTAGVLVGNAGSFIKWKPSVLFLYRMDYEAMRIDINNSIILFNDLLWVGASYRFGGSYQSSVIVANIQLQITKQLMLGYSYDYALGGLNNALNGVHEIILRYEFGFKVNAANPRYF
jgi:type IX secretion system PorP/SprF family membrane protein